MRCLIMFALFLIPLASAAVADIRPEDNEVFGRSTEQQSTHWKLVSKVMSECSSEDITETMSCLGVKAVAILDRAARMGNIELISGITLNKNTDAPEDSRNGRALLTENEITQSLPQDPAQRTSRLMDLLYDATVRFLQSHTLQISMPEGAPESISRALEEGRGKLKKKLTPILMLVGLKFLAVIPIVMGFVALLVAKALFASKLALLLAGILAVQKFIGGGGSSGFSSFGKVPIIGGGGDYSGSSGGWSSGSGSSGGYTYRRSIEDDAAQRQAYSAYAPQDTNAN